MASLLESPNILLPPLLVILTCVKILLIPTYRSTDFDVHRNWLAITHNLPIKDWYFDNVNGTTVHTLDYPPAFAWFEYILANLPITGWILANDDRCLSLLPDTDNTPSNTCVVFQRSTVIVSDIILWLGTFAICHVLYRHQPKQFTACFLLVVCNPGLLWLDHIHFQYNGMLLGILFLSLALLLLGAQQDPSSKLYDACHLAGAALYALLINLKHLYIPLGPLYVCYLFSQYCWDKGSSKVLIRKFGLLAIVTASSLLIPWIPFLLWQDNPKEQLLQIVSRLFPFGRGLVHDYWAANVWALYLLVEKCLRFVVASKLPHEYDMQITFGLPEVTPLVCAMLLFLSLVPALYRVLVTGMMTTTTTTTTKMATTTTSPKPITYQQRLLLSSVVYCSFCSFMLSYHVHEKAIMTALLPLLILIDTETPTAMNLLVWQTSWWGLLGLVPLLFRPDEWMFVWSSYGGYALLLDQWAPLQGDDRRPSIWTRLVQFTSRLFGVGIFLVLHAIPIPGGGKWEFLPLMVTSTICALELIPCWISCLAVVLQEPYE